MWFRNLRIFRLATDWNKNQLDDLLAKRPLTRCGSLSMLSRGWIHSKHESFVHSVGGQWLAALGVEQKLLPTTVIRQETQDRVAQMEIEQGRKLGRKEIRDLRDSVTLELLPRAFARRRTTWAWIDPEHHWLVIDAGSDAKVDEFMEVFLPSVGDVQIQPLQTQISPSAAMTDWLVSGDAPTRFTIDDDLELRAAASGQSAIRYVKHALEGKEIPRHIADGKIVTKLAMTWNDKVSFILTDKLEIKRLAFLDIMKEEGEQSDQEAEERFDIDFALMTGELNLMFNDLLVALGGAQ